MSKAQSNMFRISDVVMYLLLLCHGNDCQLRTSGMHAWGQLLVLQGKSLQVLLGDMPSDLAAQNLADGIWNGLSLRVSATAIILAGTLTAAVMHLLPSTPEFSNLTPPSRNCSFCC